MTRRVNRCGRISTRIDRFSHCRTKVDRYTARHELDLPRREDVSSRGTMAGFLRRVANGLFAPRRGRMEACARKRHDALGQGCFAEACAPGISAPADGARGM